MNMIQGDQLTKQEEQNMQNVSMKVYEIMLSGVNSTLPSSLTNISPDVYRDATVNRMEKDLEILKNDTILSEKLKQSLSFGIKAFYLQTPFDYELNMRLRYSNQNKG